MQPCGHMARVYRTGRSALHLPRPQHGKRAGKTRVPHLHRDLAPRPLPWDLLHYRVADPVFSPNHRHFRPARAHLQLFAQAHSRQPYFRVPGENCPLLQGGGGGGGGGVPSTSAGESGSDVGGTPFTKETKWHWTFPIFMERCLMVDRNESLHAISIKINKLKSTCSCAPIFMGDA